jgi:Ca2+/Na+ antiporter
MIALLEMSLREPILAAAHPEHATAALLRLLGGWLLAVALTLVPIVALLLWQTRRYRARRTSDIQLSLDITYLLYAVAFAAVALISPNVSPWTALAFMGAFVVYRLISRALLRRLPTLAQAQPMPLLLLRTFGHDARTQALVESVSSRWRWLGPIHLIAGTDSVFSTLAPHDFYDYLSGQLGQRAVTDLAEFQRQAREPARRDPDGLYRVETYYCHADTWQGAVEEIIQSSAAVLMDLRGFSALNAGASFELSALARRTTQAPVVLLVNGSTNMAALDAALVELRASGAAALHVLPEAGGERRTLASAIDVLMGA